MTDARASEPSRPGRSRVRFAARLLVAQALVLVACALTTWLVASLVGPTIFSDHLERAGVTGEGVAADKPNPNVPSKASHSDAPYCMQCGVQMQRAGSCHACPSCGSTSGCS